MNTNIPNTPQMNNNLPTDRQKAGKKNITTIITVVLIAQVVLAVILGVYLFRRAYQSNKDNTTNEIRKNAYDTVYGLTESANHVSNNVTISVEGVKEKADLEVLEVESSYLYHSDEVEKSQGITAWYKLYGTAKFTVDMRVAEFITDPVRQHVIVKLPGPTITQYEENYDKTEKLRFKENKFWPWDDGSVKEGVHLIRKIFVKAHTQIFKDLNMNLAYFQAAENSAKTIITTMIKALNPELNNLTVEVVFNSGTAV